MAQAKTGQRRPEGGMTLIVMVGVVIALLLHTALLNMARSGELLSETTLLYATLLFYVGAAALYLGFGVRGTEGYLCWASVSTWLGLAANTAAVAHRWYQAGHPPLTNLYETLLSFVWALAVLTVVAERRYGVRVIGMITMPLAIAGVVLMESLRTEAHPLSPLLQSNWLQVHVTLAILAYAACAVSFALAVMFLIQDRVETRTFLAISSAGTLAIYAGVAVACVEKWGGLAGTGSTGIVIWNSLRLKAPQALLSWTMLAALAVVATPVVCCALDYRERSERLVAIAGRSLLAGILLQGLSLAVLLRLTEASAAAGSGWLPTELDSSPFVLTGLVAGLLISVFFLVLAWRRRELERLLPAAELLDRITYRTICLAFPLLTLTIATGAYWANQTWGSYWSWDPKETWAAITWLVYALYLHMRITIGWRGRRAAYFAIAGFAVVIFTFFGVTYMLRGMHAFL